MKAGQDARTSRCPRPRRRPAAVLRHQPRGGARRARAALGHPRLRRDRRGLRPRPRRPEVARPRRGRRQAAAALLDLGDHPLPDPGRAAALPPGAARQPRAAAGRRRRPTAAPSGSASTRSCGCAPTSPPRAAAPSSTAPGARQGLPAKVAAVANFKGGVGKTSTAAHLAMSAALDGYRVLVVDLDSQGSMTSVFGGSVADEWDTVFPLIARDYALGPARGEPPPGRARREPPAARGHARHRARPHRAGRDPADALAEHRPRRRPAQPLLGRVPDPGLADGARAAGSSGRRSGTRSTATACSTPTTSSSSTPPRRSAT